MNKARLIDPLRDLNKLLLTVEKPARYVGGEFGICSRKEADFHMAIAFPDLYEIGMSNQALRILYNRLNLIEGLSCDRVFAPAPDFEKLLADQGIPLFTLDQGFILSDLDMLGFTLGYELGITGVLTILAAGGIPIDKQQRTGNHPIVIAGGPALSNPAPFGKFFDAAWIGEAEDSFFELMQKVKNAKTLGAARNDLMDMLIREPSIWVPGKKAVRSVDVGFADKDSSASVYPIPSMKIVQDHGAVEIMRGCPNGCRFCHAGIWYRPMRQKNHSMILSEVSDFIRKGGYREITLSSLSTGDYDGIDRLITSLNETYASMNISFQLPSLKVSTFSLPLIESISETRKSGLTFAVETPRDAWQLSINKEVCQENVVAILDAAKKRGWKSAKFYFMIGLPVGNFQEGYEHNGEEKEIVEFILQVSKKSGMKNLHINIGTFVPKPHTPYQWVSQISESAAREKLKYIKDILKPYGFKISFHDPFISRIEGFISRGDANVSEVIEKAYHKGCRLDAWDDYFNKDIWKDLILEYDYLFEDALRGKELKAELPWDSIDSGIGKGFLKREFQKSLDSTTTDACSDNCLDSCGVCREKQKVVYNSIQDDVSVDKDVKSQFVIHKPTFNVLSSGETHRLVFSFCKSGTAVCIPHLGVIEVFSKAFVRTGLPIMYTSGFNPLPRLDFASPISLGLSSEAEIATVDVSRLGIADEFIEKMNLNLPDGFSIIKTLEITIPMGVKKRSAASLLWGFGYLINGSNEIIMVPHAEEKSFRSKYSELGYSLFDMNRKMVFAQTDKKTPVSYFEAFSCFYS